jgi:hypothetical protein
MTVLPKYWVKPASSYTFRLSLTPITTDHERSSRSVKENTKS